VYHTIERRLDVAQRSAREAKAFPNLRWSFGTVQIEYGFCVRADNMHMRRSMVVWVDRHPQAVESMNRWHSGILPNATKEYWRSRKWGPLDRHWH
jgi:hypothetical protein